jgi:hypothetical protein
VAIAAHDDQVGAVLVIRQEVLRLFGGRGVAWEFVVRSGSPGEEIVAVVYVARVPAPA